jgi:Zn-finger nucleic acid-binding protein
MRCPNDNNELRIADRQGVEIDYCPECRGVWLDRGELDKIIERSAALEASLRQPQPPAQPYQAQQPPAYGQTTQPLPPYQAPPPYQGRQDYDEDDYYERDQRGYPRKRKRESFLSELFDFD